MFPRLSNRRMRHLSHATAGGAPALPPTILTEAIAQVGAILILAKPENRQRLPLFAGIKRVRYRRAVHPGEVVMLEAVVVRLRRRMGVFKGFARVDNQIVVEGTMTFALASAEGHDQRSRLQTRSRKSGYHPAFQRTMRSRFRRRMAAPPGGRWGTSSANTTRSRTTAVACRASGSGTSARSSFAQVSLCQPTNKTRPAPDEGSLACTFFLGGTSQLNSFMGSASFMGAAPPPLWRRKPVRYCTR
jgi:FabA-like domain